jgi:voltage-gated potassium channel
MKKISQGTHFAGLMYGLVLMLLLHALGTFGYMYIGGPSVTWVNALYMTFITVATIGYGEIVDLSAHPEGRLFTMAIAVVGIGTMSYLFSTFVALLLESDLNSALRRKRMEKEIAKLRDHYIVCGIGRVGSNVAKQLMKSQKPLVVIESDRAALNRWLEHHPHSMHLHDDAADDDALRIAGVMHAAGVFAVTGDDSHNLMVSLSVKLLNPNARVVARVHDIRNADKARRAGADDIVSPDFTGAMRIASAMLRPHVVNFMDQMLLSEEGFSMDEVLVPLHQQPRTIGELVPPSGDYILVATHEQGKWVFNPKRDHMVNGGASLVLMSNPGGREALETHLNAMR